MVGVFEHKSLLGQLNGPDIELVVSGTELYATYETAEGYSVVYDDVLGLFCYASLKHGQFETTRIPASSPPPEGAVLHGRETDDVRSNKIKERMEKLDQGSASTKPGANR